MNRGRIFAATLLFAVLAVSPFVRLRAQESKRDYLTTLESDKIRDAEQPALRIKLFIEFAADRLKKFHYELARPSSERMRAERLNSLLNAYTGCVDDAAELIGQDAPGRNGRRGAELVWSDSSETGGCLSLLDAARRGIKPPECFGR